MRHALWLVVIVGCFPVEWVPGQVSPQETRFEKAVGPGQRPNQPCMF
jgi:hypothetical protein